MCLALIVLCAAVMGWRAHRTFRPMYRSEAVFSVSLSFIGGTDVSSYSQYYNKSAAQQVTDTFPYLLSSDRMQELLRQRLGTASITVSYTHLDVYKRQALMRAMSSFISKGFTR